MHASRYRRQIQPYRVLLSVRRFKWEHLTIRGPGRVHVKCLETYFNDSGSIIYYWAYSASDSAAAGRYQSLFSTAQVTGSTVTVYF